MSALWTPPNGRPNLAGHLFGEFENLGFVGILEETEKEIRLTSDFPNGMEGWYLKAELAEDAGFGDDVEGFCLSLLEAEQEEDGGLAMEP